MMKRIYLCLLLLALVSTVAVAQKTKAKKEVKKEVKRDKGENEKKANIIKAPAESKFSTQPKKMPKKGTAEYEASIKASTEAIKIMLSDSVFRMKALPDDIMKFSDNVCLQYENDPILMCKIADLFLESYGNEVYCQQRYEQIKKLYPNYIDAYLNQGNLFFQLAWRDYPTYDIVFLEKAKQQIDSAKIKFPNSVEPYMRWARWQTPFRHVRAMYTGDYKHYGVDSELEALNKAFPNYQGHLRIAKHINHDLLSKEDLNKEDRNTYIIDAVEFYAKANKDSMSRIDIVDYAELCGKYNDQTAMEHALSILDYGIAKEPNYPYFYRFKLWTEAALAKKFKEKKQKEIEHEYYAKTIETGKMFFEEFDTIPKIPNDYYFMANACMENKLFEDALKYYNEELNSVKDTLIKIDALFNIVLCHYNAGTYDELLPAFEKFENLKRSIGKNLDIYDYQYYFRTYVLQGTDTTKTKEERIRCFEKADSVCQIVAEASPNYITQINDYRFWTILVGGLSKVKYNGFNKDFVILPEFLEGAERLYKSAEELVKREDVDYYRMMKGYYWAMQHYLNNDDEENAYLISEKMLSLDMPSDIELQGISASSRNDYAEWVDKAAQINAVYSSKYGKKKGKKK